jgi:hypothetical protein
MLATQPPGVRAKSGRAAATGVKEERTGKGDVFYAEDSGERSPVRKKIYL